MAGLWEELGEQVRALSNSWTAYTALGSFALYLLGYLTLRFHLTVLGIGTDLPVLDERYLFAGAKFLVYLVSTIPTVLLLLLLPATVVYLPYRLLPGGIQTKLACLCANRWQRIRFRWSDPSRIIITGIIFSVLFIQLLMRQCFAFSNVLLATSLPDQPAWLSDLLLAENDGPLALYFSGLVMGTAVSAGLFLTVWAVRQETNFVQFLKGLFAFLIAVQLLLLPVNYGILIVDKSLPRVTDLGAEEPSLNQGDKAWLVWEGNEGITYLVSNKSDGKDSRVLITLPKKGKRIRIIAYDRILRVLFAHQERRPLPPEDNIMDKRS